MSVKYNTTGQLPDADEEEEVGEEAVEVPREIVQEANLIDMVEQCTSDGNNARVETGDNLLDL